MTAGTGRKVLIVEDEALVARDIQLSLSDLGYRVVGTAPSGEEAIETTSTERPDIVLMDIHLAGELDGVQTAEILRDRFRVPVVYMTAHADAETVGRAKQAEPYGYLVKPFDQDEVRSAIEISLHKHDIEMQNRERERWFSTTLRSIADAVVACDASQRVKFMNGAAETLSGWSSAEATGRAVSDILRLMNAETGREIENPIGTALGQRRIVTLPQGTVAIDRGGTRRPIDDSVAPIVDDAGELLGAVIVFRDVTEQRRLQDKMALTSRLASLGTMAAGMAHQINNPLAANLANVVQAIKELRQLLPRAGALSYPLEAIVEALVEAQEGAERVRRIVADLRAFASSHEDVKHRTRLSGCVETALRVTEHYVRQAARLVVDIRAAPDVLANDVKLSQVFVNLLVNAAQAVHRGPEKNEIRVVVGTDTDGSAVVEVHDTGDGIPEHVLGHIFDPFFSTKEVGTGAGLGLSICHGIVKGYGGEISADTAVGRGTRFRVRLPPYREESPQPQDASPAPEAAGSPRRGRVLVIDDDPMLGKALARVLQSDHNVTVLQDARKALDLISRVPSFDVIFCDLMMPGFSGIDFFNHLRVAAPDQAEHVVFLTGGAFSPHARAFLASIPNVCVDKPFSASGLLQLIRDRLQNRS